MITLADRVKETTTTTGTGTVDLAGAVTGYQGFVAAVGDGAEVTYAIAGQTPGEWEVGIGTVTDATPDTLSRDTVIASSNSGALVNFSAGTKDVFITASAKAMVVNVSVHEPSSAATLDINMAGYEAVRIVGHLFPATDNVALYARLSNDGGSSFRSGASDYAYANDYAYTGGDGGYGSDGAAFWQISGNSGNASGEGVWFDFVLVTPAESGIKTAILGKTVQIEPTPTTSAVDYHGYLTTAEVNNAVRLLFSSGDIASGHVAVYGYPAVA